MTIILYYKNLKSNEGDITDVYNNRNDEKYEEERS